MVQSIKYKANGNIVTKYVHQDGLILLSKMVLLPQYSKVRSVRYFGINLYKKKPKKASQKMQ